MRRDRQTDRDRDREREEERDLRERQAERQRQSGRKGWGKKREIIFTLANAIRFNSFPEMPSTTII